MRMKFYQRIVILSVLVLLGSALVPSVASGQQDSIVTSTKPSKLPSIEGVSEGDNFGYGVAADGDTLVVGAPSDDTQGSNSGCAYLFSRTDVGPFPQHKTERKDAQENEFFGNSVDISGDTLVIGTYYRNAGNESHSGAAYVMKFSYNESQNSLNTETVELTGDPVENAEFGYAVAISGDVVVVGAPYDNDKGDFSGSVYVFRKNGSTWNREIKLYADDAQTQDFFGSSVAIDGDTIAVGAINGGEGNVKTGSVYVFTYYDSHWEKQIELLPTPLADSAGDKFGYSVAVEGDTIIVGAPYHDDLESNEINTGAAYVFRRNAETWIPDPEALTVSDLSRNDRFGNSVALSGNTAVVGAHKDDILDENNNIQVEDAGSAYLFRFDGARWLPKDRLITPGAAAKDEFGSAVAISGDMVVVGAYKGDNTDFDSGYAYVFTLVSENHPPVADAGEDLEVEEGSPVTLDGSQSYDLDGDDLSYSWTQPDGQDVDLGSADEATLTFTAPQCSAENHTLTFHLMVDDGQDYSEADEVEITVLPSTMSISEINSVLGSEHRLWGVDKDMYTFQGTEGDKVTVTLKAKTGGKTNNGDRATLKLKDNIRGVSFYRVDSSRLPNHICATLPATGQYRILVAGQRRLLRRKGFSGEYTLTLEGASGSLEKGAGTPVEYNKHGRSAKSHKQHPVWDWISSWFRH
jgi:hypothetical protein